MTAPARCPTCGNQGIDGWHVTRCAYLAGLRQRVEDHATKYGVDLVAARDLFAHLRQVSDDGEQAMRKAMLVLDLGWRPTTKQADSRNVADALEPVAQ